MSKFGKGFFTLPVVFFSVFFITISFSFATKGFTQNQSPPLFRAETFRSLSGAIEWKNNTTVAVKERYFSVTKGTVILDEKGNEIQLNQLPIPCEAVIKYQLRMDQNPLCLEIIVVERSRKTRSAAE